MPVGDGTFRTSFRTAMAQSGPKVIIFETSGTIDYGSNVIDDRSDYLTIAGQTAPSPGITLKGKGLILGGSHTLVQHIRTGTSGSIGSVNDPIGIPDGTQKHLYYDHVSVRWGTDENIAARDIDSFTVAWCITSEALHNPPVRPGEDHSAGMLSSLIGISAGQ